MLQEITCLVEVGRTQIIKGLVILFAFIGIDSCVNIWESKSKWRRSRGERKSKGKKAKREATETFTLDRLLHLDHGIKINCVKFGLFTKDSSIGRRVVNSQDKTDKLAEEDEDNCESNDNNDALLLGPLSVVVADTSADLSVYLSILDV
jgi:hypothetical protein